MNIKVYQSGLKFMLVNAVKRLYGGEVIFHHSLDKGICASIISEQIIDKDELKRLKNYMNVLVKNNIPFKKLLVSKKEAYDFYNKKGYYEKAANVLNISNLTISLFELEGQYNYMYTHDMPASTGELSLFDLYYVDYNELILVYPIENKLDFTFRHNIFNTFNNYDEWLNKLNINYVTDVNKIITDGNIKDLITKNDIFVDHNLYDIANNIVKNNKRVVLIAGPSSSGKTTTSKKLSLYLSSMGYNALPISLDDFFVNRDETPLDSDGNKDYECLESLDLKLFNETLNKLLNGESTKLPKFNFILGEKEFNDKLYKINDNDILVIEGLHALNPNLIDSDINNLIHRIYISPLTPLNVDRHNYVSTTDNRLLRRIIRDFRTRGRSAEDTLASWKSVRCGEEKYIFPYTDMCDDILNTAYVYEIGVLKVFVEPLLYNISFDSPYYDDARRLIDSLKTFYTISSEYVSDDNLLREFIGGSIFEEDK